MLLVAAMGCARGEAPAPPPPAPEPEPAKPALETRAEALAPPAPAAPAPAPVPAAVLPADLAFIPADAEAVVRVDLAQVGARSPAPQKSLKTLDFLLHAQQPAAWQVLHAAGITPGRELATVYLVAAKDAILLAGLGAFDQARLADALKKAGGAPEPVPGALLFRWRGAKDQLAGLSDGIVLLGDPDLVRLALAVRSGRGPDVRKAPLAAEIGAVDTAATVWGAALPGHEGSLAGLLPGCTRAHFHAALAAAGPGPDGLLALRAEFGSPEQAKAFAKELRSIFDTVSMLGASFAKLKDRATIAVEGGVLTASASL